MPALSLLISIALAQAPEDVVLTPAQITADVALAEEVYQRVHPGYTRYATAESLSAAWASVVERAESDDGMTVGDFYLAVEEVLVKVRCDHTKAELPKALREDRDVTPVYLPFRWEVIEGRGFVTEAGDVAGLAAGDELLALDDRPLVELLAEVRPLIPVDGYTEQGREGGLAMSREFMGGALEHFGALLWDIDDEVLLRVASRDGEEREIVAQRLTFEAWDALPMKRTARDFKDGVFFERIGEDAAYLRVETFVNYREYVKPDSLYDPVFKSLKEEGRETLILDLRQNGGGSGDAQRRLMAHLTGDTTRIAREIHAQTMDLDGVREHLWTWEKRALNPRRLWMKPNREGTYTIRRFATSELWRIRPDRLAFDGELIVLTGRDNSSASASLLAILKGRDGVTLVGEEGGGSAEGPTAGIMFFLTLPESGVRTRVSGLRYYNDVLTFEPGKGVSPDVLAPVTIASYLNGEDPAMEVALAMIREGTP